MVNIWLKERLLATHLGTKLSHSPHATTLSSIFKQWSVHPSQRPRWTLRKNGKDTAHVLLKMSAEKVFSECDVWTAPVNLQPWPWSLSEVHSAAIVGQSDEIHPAAHDCQTGTSIGTACGMLSQLSSSRARRDLLFHVFQRHPSSAWNAGRKSPGTGAVLVWLEQGILGKIRVTRVWIHGFGTDTTRDACSEAHSTPHTSAFATRGADGQADEEG